MVPIRRLPALAAIAAIAAALALSACGSSGSIASSTASASTSSTSSAAASSTAPASSTSTSGASTTTAVAPPTGNSPKARAARQFDAGVRAVQAVADKVAANLSATDTLPQLTRAYHPYAVALIAFDHRLGRIAGLYTPAAKDLRQLITADGAFVDLLQHPSSPLSKAGASKIAHAAKGTRAASGRVARDLGVIKR
jgi:hypothetical protein